MIVVRPAGYENQSLPVLVWIYGGGLYGGYSSDPQYNLSALVNVSQDIGQPVIAVSINYRLNLFGFLQDASVLAEGSSNAGLLDQRLAFCWIQENIASFGGDPTKVTVWGESAGAQSIGLHLTSYNGRNDDLFHSAIMESGGPEGAFLAQLAYYNAPFQNLTRAMGCSSASPLTCLRTVDARDLQAYAASTQFVWNPIVDGDFLTTYPSDALSNGAFIKIPLITGANTDEGTSFSVRTVNTAQDIFNTLMTWRNYALSPPSIRRLLDLYPEDLTAAPPFHVPIDTPLPSGYGRAWRRFAAMGGDLVMIAQRRRMAEVYTATGQPVYSYRFDTPGWNVSQWTGANHFSNVVFSFQNVSGALGPVLQFANYAGLARNIGESYVRFAKGGDPNLRNGTQGFPRWPRYGGDGPKNLVLNANGSFVENDDWRKEGIAFINTIWRELLS